MIRKMKRIGLALLLALSAFPLAAQGQLPSEQAATAYVFRFVPDKDLFFVPFGSNEAELNRLCKVLQSHIDLLRAGRMYICVSSYAATGNAQTSAQRMAYLRNSRVKSELILRAGVTEQMFVTDRRIAARYSDSLRNVVVVAFPASVEKIEQLAGEKAAEVIRSYYREIEIQQKDKIDAQRIGKEQQKREIAVREVESRRKAEEARTAAQAEAERKAAAERARLEAEEQARMAAEAIAKPYTLALRANLLRWATLTPDVGVEWRISRSWGIVADGTWTSWSWDNKSRCYALWEVSPAIHYYIGKQKRGYVGAMYHIGQFNYKLSGTGKQGDLQGGGIVGGYKLPIGKCLLLDFNLGIGCTHADFDTYVLTDGVKVRTGNREKNYWGINKAGVTLVWKIF